MKNELVCYTVTSLYPIGESLFKGSMLLLGKGGQVFVKFKLI